MSSNPSSWLALSYLILSHSPSPSYPLLYSLQATTGVVGRFSDAPLVLLSCPSCSLVPLSCTTHVPLVPLLCPSCAPLVPLSCTSCAPLKNNRFHLVPMSGPLLSSFIDVPSFFISTSSVRSLKSAPSSSCLGRSPPMTFCFYKTS